MEIVLNVVYGGANIAESTIAPLVREIRKQLKQSFASFDNEEVKQIKFFLFFNGDITSYYEETGVYQTKYFIKKKEFIASLCFDETKWSGDKSEDTTFFLSTLKILLIQCGELLRYKLVKMKQSFDIVEYENCLTVFP